MKKIKKSIIVLVFIFLILGNVSVAAEPIKVYVENHRIEMAVSPVAEDGRTLIPARAIFESMGMTVSWEEKSKTVIGTSGNKTIKLIIDKQEAFIDETKVKLDVPAQIIDGSTMVPVRFIAESLGARVDWDGNTKSVLINSENPFGRYKVIRVVDGDTIIVDFNGKQERVRMIGIDTPESVHPDVSRNVLEGEMAAKYTRDKLEGKEVGMEFDLQERDHYGRLLSYIWFSGEMFNKTLLKEGYAQVSTYPPNIKYTDEFIQLQKESRESNRGIWGSEEKANGGEFIIIDKNRKLIGPIGNSVTAEYIGSLKSDKYHYPGFTHTGQIIEDNLIYFESKEHAEANRYVPCGICFK